MTEAFNLANLGPLASLAGTWEGEAGIDISPSPERRKHTTKFRERLVFEPLGPVNNHDQVLYGLRYATTAWKLGEPDPFHEEVGYWLWDARAGEVLRCFIVPRGVSILAGGNVAQGANSFSLSADVGSETYGICSNTYLDTEFKTLRYELEVTLIDDDSFSYFEDTQLRIKGNDELFHHTDENTLHRVKE